MHARAGGYAAAQDSKPFQPAGTTAKYCRSRDFRIRHTRLVVTLDDKKRRVSGEVTHAVEAIADGRSTLALDAVDLHVKRVTSEGRGVDFRHADGKLTLDFGRKLKAGQELSVTIHYEAEPQKGLHFTGPDKSYPDKPVQIWSQGEMEETRHWIPVYDYPNNKGTWEQVVTARAKFTVVGNGRLVSVAENKAKQTKTWHYRNDVPCPSYLMMLAAGEFALQKEIAEGVPLEYYAAKGYRDRMNRSFAKTGAMLKCFNEFTGANYPYPKYAQVCVQDYIFGGMENVSATVLTDSTLHDARAHLDLNSDDLVSHELAHQWFGDLLTCRDWSHLWLNEGFATYSEILFTERDLGRDEALFKLRADHELYMDEDAGRYRRAIVTNVYEDPEDLFDRHTYEKGGAVLHMLRRVLGDEPFNAAIRHYVEKHREKSVVTQDLATALEEATGQNLDWFFEQWLYRGGHPNYSVSHEWEESQKLLRLSVKQTQKVDALTPLFRMPVELELVTEKGARSHLITVDKAEQDFFLPCDHRPLMVLFDKGGQLLKTLEHKKGREELLYQLQQAAEVNDRAWAARELGRVHAAPAAIRALEQALLRDPFWGVRQAAAAALGEIKTAECVDSLRKGLFDRNARVRRAVMAAIALFKENDAAYALAVKKLGSDESYFVRAEAALAIGRAKRRDSFAQLQKALKQNSHREVVRARACDGLALLDEPKGIPVLREWTKYGKPMYARLAAVGALAKLAKGKGPEARGVREWLADLIDDPAYFVRGAACDALADLGDKAAAADLERASHRLPDGRLRRRAKEALARLLSGETTGRVSQLENRLDRLSDENKGLRVRVEQLSEMVGREKKRK